MVVSRVTLHYSSGKRSDAIALIKEERKRIRYPPTRYYLPADNEDLLIADFEFDSVDQASLFWENYGQDAGIQQIFEQRHSPLVVQSTLETFEVFVGE